MAVQLLQPQLHPHPIDQLVRPYPAIAALVDVDLGYCLAAGHQVSVFAKRIDALELDADLEDVLLADDLRDQARAILPPEVAVEVWATDREGRPVGHAGFA